MLVWLQDLALSALNHLASDTACRVGGGLGVLTWHLGIRRRTANQTITRCLGLRGRARAVVMRQSYATMGANFLDVWTIGGPAGPEKNALSINPLWMAAALRRHGNGVFVTPHIGNWDMGAYALAQTGIPVTVYAKAQHNQGLDLHLNKVRARMQVRVLLLTPGEKTGAVKAIRELRRGGILGILADQKPSEGVPASFLGIATRCHEGPAFFARKVGVPIIPGLSLRTRAGSSQMFIGRPFVVSGDNTADVQRTMDLMSAMIASFPGQFFWQHRRFPDEVVALSQRSEEPWRTQGLRLLGIRDSAATRPGSSADVR